MHSNHERNNQPIVLIIGTRPEAIKMLPVYFALKKAHLPVHICSTGQHADLLQQVFDLFGVQPDSTCNIFKHGQDLFHITTEVLTSCKKLFQTLRSRMVLVQGDTTTSMAAALAAFYEKIPVGHIEAGLRTNDILNPFPEEVNRSIIGTCAHWHFAPSISAAQNLRNENKNPSTIFHVGNTVVDALHYILKQLADQKLTATQELETLIETCKQTNKKIILFTTHRRESFDGGIEKILQSIQQFAITHPDVHVIYPYHPNPHIRQLLTSRNLQSTPSITLCEPLSYANLVYVLSHATVVATDSGGIQEEAISLRKPVVVLRKITERTEGVDSGIAQLVGTDQEKINAALKKSLENSNAFSTLPSPYGDGTAAEKIVNVLKPYYYATQLSHQPVSINENC